LAITLNDIALKAGVSVSTVSRVLNNKARNNRISLETKEIVLKAAEDLSYRPNELARGLRLKKTNTIGLVVPDISNPFFAYVTRMIQKYSHQFGYSLIVCNTDENLRTEIDHTNLLRNKGVDGFIIMPVGVNYSHIEDLMKNDIPIVLLERSFDELTTNTVVVDKYSGSYEAVQHLIDMGHKRIAIVQGLPNTSTNNERVKGYVDALADNHISIDHSLIVGKDFRQENGYVETKLLLNLGNPPTAIFTTSDLITLGALQAITEEKLNIPDDISLVSFDDIEFAPYLVSPLTVVRQPRELMGEVAVKLLIEELQLSNKNQKKKIVLKPNLVIRKSVKNLK
jgi:LacI family transcriptional regulator